MTIGVSATVAITLLVVVTVGLIEQNNHHFPLAPFNVRTEASTLAQTMNTATDAYGAFRVLARDPSGALNLVKTFKALATVIPPINLIANLLRQDANNPNFSDLDTSLASTYDDFFDLARALQQDFKIWSKNLSDVAQYSDLNNFYTLSNASLAYNVIDQTFDLDVYQKACGTGLGGCTDQAVAFINFFSTYVSNQKDNSNVMYKIQDLQTQELNYSQPMLDNYVLQYTLLSLEFFIETIYAVAYLNPARENDTSSTSPAAKVLIQKFNSSVTLNLQMYQDLTTQIIADTDSMAVVQQYGYITTNQDSLLKGLRASEDNAEYLSSLAYGLYIKPYNIISHSLSDPST